MKLLSVLLIALGPSLALAWSYPQTIAGGSGQIALGKDNAGNQVLQITGAAAHSLFKGLNSSLGANVRQGRNIRCTTSICEIQIDPASGRLTVPGNNDECVAMENAPMTSANFFKTTMGPQRVQLGTRNGKHILLFEGGLAKSTFGKLDKSRDRKVDGKDPKDELENLYGDTERPGKNMRCVGGKSEPFCEIAIDLKTGATSNPKMGDACPPPKAAAPSATPSTDSSPGTTNSQR